MVAESRGVEQWSARVVHNHQVVGSNPTPATNSFENIGGEPEKIRQQSLGGEPVFGRQQYYRGEQSGARITSSALFIDVWVD